FHVTGVQTCALPIFAAAGHAVGTGCVALANLVRGPRVWEAMDEAFEASSGWQPHRLVTALEAAEDARRDEPGRHSAAILRVTASRRGRPWRARVTDLRVDDDPDPLGRLRRLVDTNERYHETVAAFELALDGRLGDALDRLPPPADVDDVDVVLWRALVLAAGGRAGEAAALGRRLVGRDARAAGIARRFAEAGLVDRAVVDAVLGG